MRSRTFIPLVVAILLLTVSLYHLVTVSSHGAAPPPREWGSVKGQVVWTEKVIPKNPPVAAPLAAALAGGPVLANKLVVNPKNRGVRWVLVWLADPKDARNSKFVPPIHPSLAKPPPNVVIDSPRAEFRPRVVGLWGKQNLLYENNGPVAHNLVMTSIGGGPRVRALVPPNLDVTINGFVPKLVPTPFSCGVHPWMKGYLGSFAHPYFAVTDADGKFGLENAPAGKFQLVLWHEGVGFLTMTSRELRGKVIEIKGGGVTDVGKVGMKLVED